MKCYYHGGGRRATAHVAENYIKIAWQLELRALLRPFTAVRNEFIESTGCERQCARGRLRGRRRGRATIRGDREERNIREHSLGLDGVESPIDLRAVHRGGHIEAGAHLPLRYRVSQLGHIVQDTAVLREAIRVAQSSAADPNTSEEMQQSGHQRGGHGCGRPQASLCNLH